MLAFRQQSRWFGALLLMPMSFGSMYTLPATADAQQASQASSEQAAPLDARQWLERMSMAVKTLNYSGIFIHDRDGVIDTLSILHASDEQGELERMVALTGEPREVIRNHDLVTCIFPDSDTVVVSASKPRNHLPTLDSAAINDDQYQLSLGERDRVAGHAVRVITLEPVDDYRYGHRFWIDERTYMLLRSVMLDAASRPVEQMMFTSIEYPETIDPRQFEAQVSEDQISWREPDPATRSTRKPSVDRVQFERLPPGYVEVSEQYKPMPINYDGPVSHVVLSDGMASVSVYVEHVPAKHQDRGAAGVSHMGAMSAYGLALDEAFVTVVGEVPVATVQAVGDAVRLIEVP